MMAKSALALYALVEAIVERALVPILDSGTQTNKGGLHAAGQGGATASAGTPAPAVMPKPSGERELREALERADLESVLFDANLGQAATFNRSKLSASLSAGLKGSVVEAARAKGSDVVEAVRVLDDAFSGVEDVEFLGQASKKFHNRHNHEDPRNDSFCTMPVKLRFSDREARIYFENTLRSSCGLKATQSFPKKIRDEMGIFAKQIRDENPGLIVMVRPDSRSLRINAFTKQDGEKSWNKYHTSHPIPLGIMLPGYVSPAVAVAAPNGVAAGAAGGGAGMGMEDS